MHGFSCEHSIPAIIETRPHAPIKVIAVLSVSLVCQDVVAMSCLELAHRNGHWVILNNIHLMPSWLIELEKKLDEFAIEGSHEKFRLYLSSDPSNAIPIGVLSRCIKLTNEPPAGLKANLKRAFANFSREYIEEVGTVSHSREAATCIYFEYVTIYPARFLMKKGGILYTSIITEP